MYGSITFLSDFGLQDDFAGVCRGVMKRIAPDIQIIDLTHGIAAQAVTQGAMVLARSIPYTPEGVHLAVVDPGVGGDRRGVAIRCNDGRAYVGPDNGLLSLAATADAVEGIRELTNPRYHLERVSRTFHARDIFAPVAAHLAAGAPFDDLGEAVDPASLIRIELPEPTVGTMRLGATILAADRFGNLKLNVEQHHVDEAGFQPGDRIELTFAVNSYYAVVAGTFTDVSRGDLILYEDAYGAYSVAVSGGNAAALTGATAEDELTVVPAP
jgi:S-adenosylmethionine hydrolase